MPGSWIKMRTNLWTDPRVVMLTRILKCNAASVTGALYRLWSLADEHSEDGLLPGYTASEIDLAVGIQGFAAALASPKINWLTLGDDFAQVPHFTEHNGKSAKRRDQTYQRVKALRDNAKNCNAPGVTKTVLEKEKEKEKENKKDLALNQRKDVGRCTLSQAESLYAIYPRKAKRRDAVSAIIRAVKRLADSGNADPLTYLQERVLAFAQSPSGQPAPSGDNDYRSYPATWFNSDGFADDPAEWNKPNGNNHPTSGSRSNRGAARQSPEERRAAEDQRMCGGRAYLDDLPILNPKAG